MYMEVSVSDPKALKCHFQYHDCYYPLHVTDSGINFTRAASHGQGTNSNWITWVVANDKIIISSHQREFDSLEQAIEFIEALIKSRFGN